MRDTAAMTAADSRTIRLLPFYLGDDAFCVDMQSLRSIERRDLLQVNPSREPFGWLLGHEEVPVVDAGGELFPERRSASSGRILVFEATDQRLGYLVDRVSRTFAADSSVVQTLPPVARDPRGRVCGAVIRDERLHLLIDPLALGGAGPEGAVDGTDEQPPVQSRGASGEATAVASRQVPRHGQLVSFSTRQAARAPMRYGLSLRQVAEILPPPAVVRVPAAPAWLLGLVSWRQRPVAVVDLDRRLGEGSADEPDRLLVAWTGDGNDVVAFPVRRDLWMHKLPLEAPAPRREVSFDCFLTRGVFEIADTPLVIPDVRKIAGAAAEERR